MSDSPHFQTAPGAADDAADQDLKWMEMVKLGDMAAFAQLVEAHQHRVIATVARMLGNESEAEDIAQQVFVRVWKSAARYQPSAKFTTWLYKIVRNLVINELRRSRRHPTQSLDAEPEHDQRPFQAADPNSPAPDQSLLEGELQDVLQRAIDALPEVQRLAIILRRYDDLPYEEIAEILELSVPAVKSVLFRARTDLRDRLQRYLG